MSFSSKARSAVIWNTGFNLFRDLVQFITMLVMVRILHPENYGQFALVTSVIGFLAVFSQNGFLSYILQVQRDEDTCYQDHFTASAFIQGALFVITNLVAIGLNWFPNYAPVAPFVHVMSITFLLEWPSELRRKMLERDFDWRRLRLLHAAGLLAGAVLGPVMALAGAGTYALLIPGLFVTLPFIYELFFVLGWRPTWRWSWASYRPAFHFGLTRMGSGLVVSSQGLLQSGVLTSVVGFAALGIFGRAVGLAQLACQKFATQLMYAIYPVLTRVSGRDGDKIRPATLVLRLIAWVVIPSAWLLACLAEPVVHVVYGDKWDAVIPLLMGALVWGATSSITHACYMLLLSHGRKTVCLFCDLWVLTGVVAGLLFALPQGMEMYLYSLCAVQLALLLVQLMLLLDMAVITITGVVAALFPALLASAIAWGSLLGLQTVVPDLKKLEGLLYLIPMGACFGIVYLTVLRLCFRAPLIDLLTYFPARKVLGRLLLIREFA